MVRLRCLADAVRSLTACAVLLLAALATQLASDALADDSVDLAVTGNATISGTIRPSSERESLVLMLGRGAKVVATAKPTTKGGAFVPRLDLVDPAFANVATGTTTGRKTKLKTLDPIATGAAHRLRTFGDGISDGDYTLAVKIVSKAAFSESGVAPSGGDTLTFTFGAPAGAKVRVAVRATSSPATIVPVLEGLVSPTGRVLPIGVANAAILLDESGDWTLRFHDGSNVGGAYLATAKLSLPRGRPARIDISSARLTGAFGGSQQVFGRFVTDDGALVAAPDVGGSIDGTSVAVPQGAMPYPAVITIAETAPFGGMGQDHPAGPAIQFGPQGLTFAPGKQATLTIPYDASAFVDVPNELTVYVQDEATGVVTTVDAPLDLSVPGLVSFATSHFSIYVAGTPRPRAVAGSWIVASVSAGVRAEYGGHTSAAVGPLVFDDVSGSFQSHATGLSSDWARTSGLGGPFAIVTGDDLVSAGSFVEESATRVVLDDGVLPLRAFVRRAGGDALVLAGSPDHTDSELTFALRRANGPATLANVAGRWHLVGFSAGAAEDTANGPVRLAVEAIRGTATFGTDGRATLVSPDGRDARSSFPAGLWKLTDRSVRLTGTLSVSPGGLQLVLGGPSGSEAPIPLHACLGGGVLLGARTDPVGQPTLFAFVREAGGRSDTLFDDAFRTSDLSIDVLDTSVVTAAQHARSAEVDGEVVYGPQRSVSYTATYARAFEHRSDGLPTTNSLNVSNDAGTYTFTASGAYRDTFGFSGAMAPGGEILIGVLADTTRRLGLSVALPGAALPR